VLTLARKPNILKAMTYLWYETIIAPGVSAERPQMARSESRRPVGGLSVLRRAYGRKHRNLRHARGEG
jgi:hypothetical protein